MSTVRSASRRPSSPAATSHPGGGGSVEVAQFQRDAGDRGPHDRETIEVEDLVTHYPGNSEPTLKGVNMRIYPNEIVCIMGGSGSGKSTLLRQIMALDRPMPEMAGIEALTVMPAKSPR